jgi:hypothetical protein
MRLHDCSNERLQNAGGNLILYNCAGQLIRKQALAPGAGKVNVEIDNTIANGFYLLDRDRANS